MESQTTTTVPVAEPEVIVAPAPEIIAVKIATSDIEILEAEMYAANLVSIVKNAISLAVATEQEVVKDFNVKAKAISKSVFNAETKVADREGLVTTYNQLATDKKAVQSIIKDKRKAVKEANAEAINVTKAVEGKVAKMANDRMVLLEQFAGRKIEPRAPSFGF